VTRFFVGITGASGHAYAAGLLRALAGSGHEVDVSVTEAGAKVLRHELGVDAGARGERLAEALPAWLGPAVARSVRAFASDAIDAPPSSGTALSGGAVLCPCSMGTLARVAAGFSSNLVERAADVALKEGRKLVVVPRETPLSEIHLENMLRLARLGAVVLPAMPGFYHRPGADRGPRRPRRREDPRPPRRRARDREALGGDPGRGRGPGDRASGDRHSGQGEEASVSRLADYLSLVRFSHSIFALPFALCGAWLAAGGPPPVRALLLVVACAVAARTAAMAFNRIVDREIDARNPRTQARELPARRISPRAAAVLVVASSAAFVLLAFALNRTSGYLSFPVLAVLLAYSYVKRFSASAHFVLGLALALAPLGAWIAVRGGFDGASPVPVLWLAGAVLTWVAGFDLIYACQDVEFDRRSRLHSIPARLGVGRALWLSIGLHVITVACLVLVGRSARLSFIWWGAVLLAALLLAWEHSLVSEKDLSRVNAAFFTVNGWVSVLLFAGLALDRGVLGGAA
jgi:4-hydroxybenzoate polyprenyltransferase